MAKIYLVRHGKAEQGWGESRNPGLGEIGRFQAVNAAKILKSEGPLPILVSPLARTLETASPLEEIWNVKARIEPRVSEIPSPSSGITDRIQWLKTIMSGKWSHLDAKLCSWRRGVIEALCSLSRDTVVVTHFIAINAAVGYAMEDDRVVVFKPDNTSITIMEASDRQLQLIDLGLEDESIVL
jgi:broad specificity phosphatase PhoE